MASVFTKIIRREIPAHIIAEEDHCLAFLDVNPLVKGHCLVIPKQEIDYIYDMNDELLIELHLFAKQVALSLKQTIPCLRIGLSVIGLEVPHAHIHLIPMNSMSDVNFSRPKLHPTPSELSEMAQKIRKAIPAPLL